MREVLMICNLFSPANSIAAVRPTKLVKYFSRSGEVKITVIANNESNLRMRDKTLIEDIRGLNIDVIYVEESQLLKQLKDIASCMSNHHKKTTICGTIPNVEYAIEKKYRQKLKQFVLFVYNRIVIHVKAWNMIKKLSQGSRDYDVIMTFGPNSSDYVGRYYKRTHREVKWIADYRDPVLNNNTPKIFEKLSKNYCKNVAKRADWIVAVSPGYLESLYVPAGKKTAVLTNGFDREDLKTIHYKKRKDKLTFVSVGALYRGRRKLLPFLKTIRELIDDNSIDIRDVSIKYAGPSEQEFMQEVFESNMEETAVSHGKITRIQSLELQANSDVLLLPSWCDFDGEDIIPGKFLEYLMMKKKIITIVSGAATGDYVSKLINNYQLGFAYEEARGRESVDALKKYVLQLYLEWKGTGELRGNEDKDIILRYDYDVISKQYLKIIREI